MPLYTRESVERLKDAVDMVELVGSRTELRRVGARYTGLCPFHEERTPSFSVNAEHKLYHCFGCGASGDAIRFVQASEGLDFPQALEYLADRYNMELAREQEDPRAERRRRRGERLLRLVERTAAYYERYLWESSEAGRARAYLTGRGLGEEVLRRFRVGYAPSAWDRVTVAAQRDGFTPEELAAAGLSQRGRQGGFYDRFRARITFPLADLRGRVVGFGARAVREEQRPKYLNTSENELFHKGRQLFGIDLARADAAKKGHVVVVEGYTDVLALHQAGFTEAVAIMGTALTSAQLARLAQAAGSSGAVYLALDADRSGHEAMLRASRAARERGLELMVVDMPEGQDPADLVSAEGAGAFDALLRGAVTVPEFQIRRILADSDLGTPRGRDDALEEIRPLIAALPEMTATRDHIVRYAADRLDVPVSYLTTRVEGAAGPSRAPALDGGSPGALETLARADRVFLAMCLAEPRPGREYLARLTDEHLSSETLRRVRDHLASHFDDPLEGLPAEDPALAAAITEVAMLAEEEPSSEPALRLGFLQLELRRIERGLRQAEESDDFERQRALWSEREQVRQGIARVMGEAP